MGKASWVSDGRHGREARFILDNDPSQIRAVLDELHDAAVGSGLWDEETATLVDIALHEALLNAIHHGNLELDSCLRRDDDSAYLALAERRRRLRPYRDRRVSLRARFTPWEAEYVIRDDGPGFDPESLPDPTDPARIDQPSGRGLLMIRLAMDEVKFNATGNQVTLVKRRGKCPLESYSESRTGVWVSRRNRVGA